MADTFTAGVASTAGTGAKGPSFTSVGTLAAGVASTASTGAQGPSLTLGASSFVAGCAHRRAVAYGPRSMT